MKDTEKPRTGPAKRVGAVVRLLGLVVGVWAILVCPSRADEVEGLLGSVILDAWCPASPIAIGSTSSAPLNVYCDSDEVYAEMQYQPVWLWFKTVEKWDASLGDFVEASGAEADAFQVVHPNNQAPNATLQATPPSPNYWRVTLVARVQNAQNPNLFAVTPPATTQVLTAVGVEKVILDGSDPDNGGPVTWPVNLQITVRAKPLPPRASWPPGSPPTWTLTQPQGSQLANPPAGGTAPITPVVPGTYTLTASLGTSSTQPFEITAWKVEITDGADTPLTEAQNTIVGKKVHLKGRTTPATVTPTVREWEIEGERIKNYVPGVNTGVGPVLLD